MRRIALAILALVGFASSGIAGTPTYFGFKVGVTNAPPAPRFAFRGEPMIVAVAQTKVHKVEDEAFEWDLFRYGGSWFLYSNGFWYRAAKHRGPYRVVDVRVVPTVVLRVSPGRWKNHPHGAARTLTPVAGRVGGPRPQ